MGGFSLITYGLLFLSLYFEVFVLVAFLERAFFKKPLPEPIPAAPSRFPKVGIIVPCYNEERTLASTVESLLALEYPKDKLDIIVVDDGSSDDTLSVAKQFESPQVRVFTKQNGGKHTAMNLGLEHTDAELIGCLDADSVVSSDGLLRVVPIFENATVAAVTPGIHVREPRNLLQHLQHVEYRLSLFNRFIMAALGSVFITPGPFSIFRTSVVRSLGGWRYAHSTEDMEMALRIQNAGYLIANAPKAVVHTGTPTTLRGLFRQRVRWTYGWLRNAVDYRFMLGNRRFGDLGLIVLPFALISMVTGIYFFVRVVWEIARTILSLGTRVVVTGTYPHVSFDLFYLNTSAFFFIVFVSVGVILTLICVGSFIGTGKRTPPGATPLFLLFYSFLAPLWLIVAVIRATLKSGVRWR